MSDSNAAGPAELTIALLIETVGLGGAEMVVLQLAQELRRRGHSVLLLVPTRQPGWLTEQFEGSGIEWQAYEPRRRIELGLPRRLARMLAARGVDVIHSHEFLGAVIGAATGRVMGRPHVTTMHGNQKMTRKWQRRAALRWAFRRSHAVVAVSEDTRRHLESTLGLRPGAVTVVQNGIPFRPGDRAATRAALGLADDTLLLLAVGSLMPRKGHALLIEAMSRLAGDANLPDWQVAIAGQGDERPRLEQAIAERGLAGRVRLLGPRNDIPDLQAAADVFVMPSLWEGLPLAILEAMFPGNPIVASRTSGIPEAIDDGVHGLLVPPGDVDALTAALRRLLGDAQLRAALGRAAAERARARFSIDVMTSAYERLFRSGLAAQVR